MDMDICMGIDVKSVDMDINTKFYIHGNPVFHCPRLRSHRIRVFIAKIAFNLFKLCSAHVTTCTIGDVSLAL